MTSATKKPEKPVLEPSGTAAVDEEKAAELKVQTGRRLGSLECGFCGVTSATADDNASHMGTEHGFFIPELEYLVNLEGLLAYLGDKIGVGHCCVWCHRVFESLGAVRQHMADLSHCKMVFYEDSDSMAGEYDEFYNFEEAIARELPELKLSADGSQLMIGDNKSIGHRDYKVRNCMSF